MQENTPVTMSMKYEINSNTVVLLGGFITTLITLVSLWNNSQYKLDETSRRIDAHDVAFTAVDVRIDAMDKQAAADADIKFRVAAIEKSVESVDNRVSRVSESYGNQFTDIRGALSSIATQQALTNQALQRLELSAVPPKR